MDNSSIVFKGAMVSFADVVALFLAIAPVLDPYIIAEIGSGITIRINDIFVILLGGIALLKNREISRYSGFLLGWCSFIALISIFGLIGIENGSAVIAYKNIIIWSIYSFLIMYLWKVPCREKFLKFTVGVGVICSIVILLQFIFGNLRIDFWNGKIPFIQLSKYDDWAGYIDHNTFDVRPCGIFQEPSYCGIYLLVVLSYCLSTKRIKTAILFIISMILTTSMVAIVGGIAVVAFYMLFSKNYSKKFKIEVIVAAIFFITVLVIPLLLKKNEAIQSLVEYIIRRLTHIGTDLKEERMGSTRWRLVGHLPLFSQYNTWQKLFGMGTQQYARYFNVIDYSNNFVNIILNYGIIGSVTFSFLFKSLFDKVEKENHIYFYVTIMIFMIDQQWFNWFFFYLLSACVLKSKNVYYKNERA